MTPAEPAGSDAVPPAGSSTRAGRVFLVLAAVAVVLVGLSLVLLRATPWPVLRDPASPLVQFLDVRAEANLHTWFNVAVLTVGAVAHVAAGGLARRTGRDAWPWFATACVLVLLSVDDLASLHERLGPLGQALGAGEGALHFPWVLPGLVLGAGLAVAAGTVARRLPRQAALWLAGGIAALLAAAVGLEVVGGALLSGVGDGPAYILVSHLEELVETLAAAMLLCSALSVLSLRPDPAGGGVTVAYKA